VIVSRELAESSSSHFETTPVDTSFDEAVMDYAGLGTGTLTGTFGAGSYSITLAPATPAIGEAGTYVGPWSCGPDVPLAQDSTLAAHGFDPALELPGTWRLEEERPIE
jgi:hypothetical protein